MAEKWFNMSVEDTIKNLRADVENGLSSNEVKSRQEKYGLNELQAKKKKSIFVKFLEQFKDFMIIILIISAIISGVVGVMEGEGITDTIIILVVVVVNAIIGVAQENKAEKSLEALQKLSSHVAKVMRDGKLIVVPSKELVPGDIIILETGDYIPADLRIIEAVNLKSNDNISCINVKDENDIVSSQLVIDSFPDIKDKMTFSEVGVDLFAKITSDINKKNVKDAKEAEDVFKEKTPYVTYALIAVNIIMFILMYIFGNGSEDTLTLLRFGALNKIAVINFGYHRLITSAFLHIGVLHLIFNMYALYVLGKDVETYYGKVRFTVIYFVSALIGSLFSLVFADEYVVSAGASGAIFGLMGSLLYFGYHYRVMLNNAISRQILPVIGLNLLIGFLHKSGEEWRKYNKK